MGPLGVALAAGGIDAAGSIWANMQGAAESKRGRIWATNMSNSAYQRAVADMEAAGLNPALAYGQGGAGTPGSGLASFDNPLSGGVSSALAARAQVSQLKAVEQQTQTEKERTRQAYDQAQITKTEADMSREKWSYYFTPEGRPRPALKGLLDAEFSRTMASSAQSVSEAKLRELDIPERQALARLFETAGAGGKGMQLLMPLLMSLMRR